MTYTANEVIKFRNKTFPFSFPAWVNGNLIRMTTQQVLELEGKVVWDNGLYTRFNLTNDQLTDSHVSIDIEWLNQWFEQISEFSKEYPGLADLEDKNPEEP